MSRMRLRLVSLATCSPNCELAMYRRVFSHLARLVIVLVFTIGLGRATAASMQRQDEVVNSSAPAVQVQKTPASPRADEPAAGTEERTSGSETEAESLGTDGEQTPAARSADQRLTQLMSSFTIFVLAIFVGFEIITKVPPTLHTPLMSGSNAISGITIVGAILVAGAAAAGSWLGAVAVVLATINVVGGFLVTHRMLSMFQKRRS